MRSKVYLALSTVLGLYIIYGIYTSLSRLSEYGKADATILLILFTFFGVIEFIFIKKYMKYSNPEYKKRVQELRDTERNARNEAVERAAAEEYEKQKNTPGSKTRKDLLGADLCIKIKHMAGLPISEGSEVFVYRCEEKVIFERNQDIFELEASNMKDVLIKTDTEIHKSYVSSVGGAVGGYMLFGPLGAMVGGRAKEKKSTSTEKYLIFDYINKDGNRDFISFEVTKEPQAILFNTNHYDLSKNEKTTISL